MNPSHYDEVLQMMRVFYDSPAVLHTSSDEVLKNDIEACIGDNPYLDGYVFVSDGRIAGYSMVSKSFTTEYGGMCGWIEDLYIREEFRRQGIARQFFDSLPGMYPEIVRFKLEVEPENERAIGTYKSCGYSRLHYDIMEEVLIDD
ncbi:MAG: GNAT family N-acetyltransferase [Lachnospiraceae bacterium]|nr:GNAT family N-acetyltransferase [Lachnospiraceae bacterium]